MPTKRFIKMCLVLQEQQKWVKVRAASLQHPLLALRQHGTLWALNISCWILNLWQRFLYRKRYMKIKQKPTMPPSPMHKIFSYIPQHSLISDFSVLLDLSCISPSLQIFMTDLTSRAKMFFASPVCVWYFWQTPIINGPLHAALTNRNNSSTERTTLFMQHYSPWLLRMSNAYIMQNIIHERKCSNQVSSSTQNKVQMPDTRWSKYKLPTLCTARWCNFQKQRP